MKVVTQHFIGTTEEWKSENPKLYNAVWGFEKTVDGKIFLKIGNGVALWNDLEYVDKNYIKGLPEELAEIKSTYDGMRNAIEEEAYARKNAEEELGQAIALEAKSREETDESLRQELEQETGERKQTDLDLRQMLEAETDRAEKAETELDNAKINKSVAGENKTLVQKVEVKEITPNSFTVAHKNVNVESGAVTETEFELPQASEQQSGIMPAESYAQIEENTRRIESLEGRAVHFSVTLNSDNPDQAYLQAVYEEVSGNTGTPPDQVTLDDLAYSRGYTYYETEGEWVYKGSLAGGQMTNTSHGLIRGVNEDGKVFAEDDGTGSVVGWSVLKTDIANLETAIADKAEKNAGDFQDLQANIEAEVQTRQDADQDLQANIETEVQMRQDADAALQNNINSEASARAEADQNLQILIDAITIEGLENLSAQLEAKQDKISTQAPLVFGGNKLYVNYARANDTNYPVGTYLLIREKTPTSTNVPQNSQVALWTVTSVVGQKDQIHGQLYSRGGNTFTGEWRIRGIISNLNSCYVDSERTALVLRVA